MEIVNPTDAINTAWYRRIFRNVVPEACKKAFWRYEDTPNLVRNRWRWGLRRALYPYFDLHCWVMTADGSRFFLGKDRIDDSILTDILRDHKNQYFPSVINSSSREFLILDVGAHHGMVATEMLRHYGLARLIAVEPNPDAVKLLRKNLGANDLLDRVEIIDAAVGPDEGSAFLQFSDEGSWGDTTAANSDGGESESSRRNGITIPQRSMAKILNGRKPNLVKCNAEGAEFTVFPQIFSLGLRPENVIVMIHPEYGSVDNLMNDFLATGYEMRSVSDGVRRPTYHGFLRK